LIRGLSMSINTGLKVIKKDTDVLNIRVEILKSGSIKLNDLNITKYEFKKLSLQEQDKVIRRSSNIIFDDGDSMTDVEIMGF